jgi:hypothetical protein
MRGRAAVTAHRSPQELEDLRRDPRYRPRGQRGLRLRPGRQFAIAGAVMVGAERVSLFQPASPDITDPTGRGDCHGDVEAVRRADTEDPVRKVDDGGPAVRPPSA